MNTSERIMKQIGNLTSANTEVQAQAIEELNTIVLFDDCTDGQLITMYNALGTAHMCSRTNAMQADVVRSEIHNQMGATRAKA